MLKTVAWGLIGSDGIALNIRGATSSRLALGSYEIALSDDFQIDDSEMMLTVTPNASGRFTAQAAAGGSDTFKPIETFDSAGAAADVEFFFKIEKLNLV